SLHHPVVVGRGVTEQVGYQRRAAALARPVGGGGWPPPGGGVARPPPRDSHSSWPRTAGFCASGRNADQKSEEAPCTTSMTPNTC
ncbi:hypothetical protein, partial [Nocardia asiatica]|uniref:hypothetical protein n=1 Tax=Nocardia asiatica TaxID=209252 RepID=UPI0024581B88